MNHKIIVLIMTYLLVSSCRTGSQQQAQLANDKAEPTLQQLLDDAHFQQYIKYETLNIQRVQSDYYNDSQVNYEVIKSKMAEKTGLRSKEKIAIYEANGMNNAKEYVEQVDMGFQSLRLVFKKYPALKQEHLFEKIMEKIQLNDKFKDKKHPKSYCLKAYAKVYAENQALHVANLAQCQSMSDDSKALDNFEGEDNGWKVFIRRNEKRYGQCCETGDCSFDPK